MNAISKIMDGHVYHTMLKQKKTINQKSHQSHDDHVYHTIARWARKITSNSKIP
jgi:hypothetical protein